jgi:protein-L-isoaspartate(D-aspartate) O-methyltransferase
MAPGGVSRLVQAVRRTGIGDERVLGALAAVPRASFVPPEYTEEAYVDVPIPIPHDQVTTQPSLSARMIEALALTGSERVLEVGTGYGFQTALLARLAAFVWSVERFPDLAATALQNLEGVGNVEVVVGDGSLGLPERAPFDAILVSAAFPAVPAPLAEQLRDGARLVQPIGSGGSEDVLLFEKHSGRVERVGFVTGARFVRLYGEHGFRP